jgi:hypothetical protein
VYVGVVSAVLAARAAPVYPLTVVASATASSGPTTINSTITVRVDRLIEPSRRDRLIAALRQTGYQGFLRTLKTLPAIGNVAVQNRRVPVKYAWETSEEGKHRLVIAADAPLFFLPGDEAKTRSDYQLTVVDLLLDDSGGGTGSMSGAARARPAPDGGVLLDDFATAPVRLTVQPPGR